MLVPSVALAAASTDDDSHAAATVVIDLAPAPGVPMWFSRSFEQTITGELAGFARLGTIAKQDVAIAACRDDRACRLQTYRASGVDLVLFGTVSDDAIAYELYQTWTPARLETGSIDVGRSQSMVGLQHAVLRAFHVVLKHGGLLDQKPYMFERAAPGGGAPAAGWQTDELELGLVAIALLVLPFALAWLGGESRRVILRMRSARRACVAVAVLFLAAISLDPRRIADGATTWGWLVAGIGGLGWGAFLVLIIRRAFPPLDGLERVRHGELTRVLAIWCLAAVQRLVGLAIVCAPVGWLVARLGEACALPARWTYLALAPAVVWLGILWLASWIECSAARLDRRYVAGPASLENPWSREVGDYLLGYVRRTGWDLDPELLANVIFLPGKKLDGVVAYGGGPSRARIVIDRELLVMTMGPLIDVKPNEKPALWPDWTIAQVSPHSPPRPTEVATAFHDFRGRKQRTIYPGMQRKPLGQAATLLGHVTPAPGQLVPLISDNPQDLAIVRELLSEHYPWFAPDPDEEFDATDPTDKDFLFGAIVHALGAVRRGDTQLATLRLLFGTRIARWSTPVSARLADGYAALNFARHHLIQHLHYTWKRDASALTARASAARLHEVSSQILRAAADPAAKPPRALRARLAWLSRFFAEPIVDRRGAIVGRVAAGVVVAALLVAAGVAVARSVAYHAIYVERMNAAPTKGSADGEVQPK